MFFPRGKWEQFLLHWIFLDRVCLWCTGQKDPSSPLLRIPVTYTSGLRMAACRAVTTDRGLCPRGSRPGLACHWLCGPCRKYFSSPSVCSPRCSVPALTVPTWAGLASVPRERTHLLRALDRLYRRHRFPCIKMNSQRPVKRKTP